MKHPFHYRDWNAKVGSQEIPGVTNKFGLGVQNEAGKRLIEFSQKNTLVIANTFFQQHKRWLYTWKPPDVNTKIRLIIFFAAEDGEALHSQQKQDQELTCGSDHELLVAKFRLQLKKVGKTRPFMYDLNQIPYNFIVEVTDSRD